MDLPALLADNDPARFLYFAAFFGRAAFEDGPLGVATLLKESADYAHGVGNTPRRDEAQPHGNTAPRHAA